VWLVTSAWLAAGRLDHVEAAVARIRDGFPRLPTSDLIRGVVDVIEGHRRLRDGRPGAADVLRSGLALVRGMRATWWVRRAIRLLEAAGSATPEELAEASVIEARLGVVDQAL
jgi:hypothetical protein